MALSLGGTPILCALQQQQSLDSIERVVTLVATHKAQLWIGHDKDITARINRAPKFYE